MRRLLTLTALALPAAALAAPYRQPVPSDVVVTAYYDHGGVRDWACTDWTYGGHHGTDIAIIGRFEAQDQGRDIVAAQAGRVTRTHDGEFDRCTTADCAGGSGFGNHVYIEHPDGQITIYGHMRQGSVRVAEGQEVACGQVIGQVGSSGYSTGPHCHFEVRVGGTADDPFSGQCGGPLSYWVAQGDHRGLPSSDCAGGEPPPPPPPPPPPMRPDMHLSLSFAPAAPRACDFDDCADFIRDGSSGGIFDAWAGEVFQIHVVVANQGEGGTNGESPEDSAATLQYALPPGLTPLRYEITTDWPAKDRATWAANDAQSNPANPPADAPPAAGELRLNGYSGGEAKRVSFTVRADASTVASGAHLPVQAWVKHLKGYYGEKTGWDDPVEVNDGQSYNGGDLKVGGELDVFDPTAFLFDSPEAAQVEGWRRCAPDAVGRLEVDPNLHALAVEVIAAGPCVEGPRTAVPLADFAGVQLVVQQPQTQRRGVLQWTTLAQPDFADDRAVEFTSRGGGQPQEIRLAVPWDRADTLTRLRLVPVPDPGAGGPLVALGEVRLISEVPGGGSGPGPIPNGDAGPGGLRPGDDAGAAGFDAGQENNAGAGGNGAVVPEADRKLDYSGSCSVSAPGAPGAGGSLALSLLFAAARVAPRRQAKRPKTSRTAGGRSSIFSSTKR
jgi:murein DD-endopeptidase MepM/ murein hydrolase activator NlpD